MSGIHSRVRLAVPIGAVLVGIAPFVAGCGGASDTATPAAVVSSPATGPSAAADSGGVDAAALGQRIAAAVADRQTAKVSMTAEGASGTTESSGAMRFGDQIAMAMEITAAGSTTSVIMIDGAMYVKPPGLPGNKWLAITPDGTDPISRAMAPLLQTVSSNASVTSMLENYRGVPVTQGAGTTLDGVEVTEYTYALDEKALLAGLPESMRSASGDEFAGASGTMAIWLDADDLVHKVVNTIDLSSGKTTTTLRYTDWGEPVTITAPSASELLDVPAAS